MARIPSLLICACASLASVPAAHAASSSCIVAANSIDRVDAPTKEKVDSNTIVLRPCSGRVLSGAVVVTYGIGEGDSRRMSVGAGESIDKALRSSLAAGQQLADVWPSGGVLARLVAILGGSSSGARISGTSGFDEPGNRLSLTGDVLMQPFRLDLAMYGLDGRSPLSLVQGKKKVAFAPSNGGVALTFAGFSSGPATIEQSGKVLPVNLVGLDQDPELGAKLEALRSDASPDANLMRALLLQGAQFQPNAVAEYIKGTGK